jgi:hypothetical protein
MRDDGQWDAILAEAYDLDYVLIEVNKDEDVVAAYQRGPVL